MEESKFFWKDGAEGKTDILRERRRTPQEGENMGRRNLRARISKEARRVFTREYLLRRLPVINWMRHYKGDFLLHDMVAGVTVGLTAIPQGIAYAVVAGLEPQYGLYSGFMGCFVYFLLGSVKEINIGPTAIIALMTQPSVLQYNSDLAVLLCFFSGCIILVTGLLHLGFLVNFISTPVTLGFSTAAAVTIAFAQLKGLLGIPGRSNHFLETCISIAVNIEQTRFPDLILGFCTIIFLIAAKGINSNRKKASIEQWIFILNIPEVSVYFYYHYKHYSDRSSTSTSSPGVFVVPRLNEQISRHIKKQAVVSTRLKIIGRVCKFFSLGRNAIAVIIGAFTAYIFELEGLSPFILTGKVRSGLPEIKPPPFSTTVTRGNETEFVPFEEMMTCLEPHLVSVPLVAILETVTLAKSFTKGMPLDATQEMIALGACNIAGSFFQSMPLAGSFTRSALNNASGVKTPLGGIFTGCLVLLALTLTSTFHYIPKATLAAVIITAMIYMVEYHEIVFIWKARKMDFIPLFVTVACCLLLGIDFGILIGVGVNLLFILFRSVRPKIAQEELTVFDEDILVIRPEETLFYPGANYLRDRILQFSKAKPRNLIVFDGRNIQSIDSTVGKIALTLAEDFEKSEQDFVFWNWQPKPTATLVKMDEKLKKYFVTETLEQFLEKREANKSSSQRELLNHESSSKPTLNVD